VTDCEQKVGVILSWASGHLVDLASDSQWLKWFCEAGGGGSPDEAGLEQTP